MCCRCIPHGVRCCFERLSYPGRLSASAMLRPYQGVCTRVCRCVRQAREPIGRVESSIRRFEASKVSDVVCFVFGYAQVPASRGATVGEEVSCIYQGDEALRSTLTTIWARISRVSRLPCPLVWCGCTHRLKVQVRLEAVSKLPVFAIQAGAYGLPRDTQDLRAFCFLYRLVWLLFGWEGHTTWLHQRPVERRGSCLKSQLEQNDRSMQLRKKLMFERS